MESKRYYDYKWGFVMKDFAHSDNTDQAVIIIHEFQLQAAQRARDHNFRQDICLQLVSINDLSCLGMRAEEVVEKLVDFRGVLKVVVKDLEREVNFTLMLDDDPSPIRHKRSALDLSIGSWRPWQFLRSTFPPPISFEMMF